MELYKIDAEILAQMFRHGTLKLVANKAKIDALNVFPVPDGDTGTNMSLTMSHAIESLNKQELTSVAQVAKVIAKGSLMGARGNSGVILSQIFRGFARGCEDLTELNLEDFVRAIELSSEAAYHAVLKPVEGTILTVIREIAEHLSELDLNGLHFEQVLDEALIAGQRALNNTPNLLPALKQAGVIDAGGQGLMFVLEGFYEIVKGTAEEIEVTELEMESATTMPAQAHIQTGDIKFGYCTEFIIRGNDLEHVPLKSEIETMGDSMVYVPDDDILKVHIHTNEPMVVIDKAMEYGHIVKVKIENMREQHSAIVGHDASDVPFSNATTKKIGVVAVAAGDGIEKILRDLGVDSVIRGGQTMNPSTADIEKAIAEVNAEKVIVMPNNSNIIMAAEQAAELSPKQVVVVPTKTVLQSITALLAFSNDFDLEENAENMAEELANVTSMQVTYAVRDTEFEGVKIKKDDFLCIVDGVIKASDKNIDAVIKSGLDEAIDDDSELITLYYGEDTLLADAEMLKTELMEAYPEQDFELQYGGQPVYHYLIGIE